MTAPLPKLYRILMTWRRGRPYCSPAMGINRLGDYVRAPSGDSVLTECTAVVGHGPGEHVLAAGAPRPQVGGKL